MSGAAHTPGPKRITLFGGIVLFLASWHLFGGLNDNVTSRAAMITAIVEHGTPYIDAYADLAGDKAFVGNIVEAMRAHAEGRFDSMPPGGS